jgi:hypothetical protein
LLVFSSYPHHSTIPQPNNFIMDCRIRLLSQKGCSSVFDLEVLFYRVKKYFLKILNIFTRERSSKGLLFARVGTYVQRGSKFCFVVLLVLADTLIRILYFRPISPCFQHIAPLHAALPCSLALQPCPAVLSGSLARQPCRKVAKF